MRLAEYEFDLQHKPGRANANADAFSRYPIDANLYYTDRYYSDVVLEPFTGLLRTCITLYSLLGFDSHDQLFHNSSIGYLPFDFTFDCLVTLPDTQSYTDNATNDDTQRDFIALQPSLIEFRAQQRACTELGEIIDFLERTSLDKLGQKVASKKLRSLEIKCNNYFIDPISNILILLPKMAQTIYLLSPWHYVDSFYMLIIMLHFQEVIVTVILLSAFFVRNTTGQVWSEMSVNGSRNV